MYFNKSQDKLHALVVQFSFVKDKPLGQLILQTFLNYIEKGFMIFSYFTSFEWLKM